MKAQEPWQEELVRSLPKGRVRCLPEETLPYGQDESDLGTFPPEVVVLAESTADVCAVLKLASRYLVPVVPVGARSGKSGGSLAVNGGIALSLERMNRILEVNPVDLVARVEPGVIIAALQAEVEKYGLFYPPDPNSLDLCSIGGNVAENAGGPRAMKYGVTREYVIGVEVVLASGEPLRLGRRALKGVAGYDLTALVVGSEGTLAVVTEVTLKLVPRPRFVATGLVVFATVEAAVNSVARVLRSGVLPRCLELFDDVSLEAAARGSPFRFPKEAGAALLVETDGNDEDYVFAEMARVAESVRGDAVGDMIVAQSEAQRREIWETRKWLSQNLKKVHPLKLSEDVAVPPSRIPDLVRAAKGIGARLGLAVATYGHAGDGNLHCNVLFDEEGERPKVNVAVAAILREAISLGGTITGEHGVGLAKRDFLELEQGTAVVDLERRLKALFDPNGILNPGKIFR